MIIVDCLLVGQLIFNNLLFNFLEFYSKKEFWVFWYEYKEDSRGQIRDGVQSYKDFLIVVFKIGVVVVYIFGNYGLG